MSIRRTRRLALVAALPVALVLAPSLAAANPAVDPNGPAGPAGPTQSAPPAQEGRSALGSRIGIPLMPDTQFYSRYDTPDTGMQLTERFGSNPFEVQARWISEHRAALNAPLAIHVGDVVDQAAVAQEWQSARRSLQPFFDAGMPFSILAGNHDIAPGDPYLALTGAPEFAARETLAGRAPSGYAEFHVFEAEGQQFLNIALGWDAPAEMLAWAQGVIEAHPTLPVILSTHRNIDVEGDGATPQRNEYSEYLWENLIRGNDQIFAVVSGHHHGASVEVRRNDEGNDVVHILTDYQMAYQGGNGYMNLLELDLTDNALDLATFSPWVQTKPRETLTSFDEPILDDPHQEWTIPFDFAERFGGFNPGFRAGTADEADLTAAAKTLATNRWQPPTSAEHPPATNAQDFPVVAGTLAHWRPGQSALDDGQAVPAGSAILDATGHAPLMRGALDAPGVVGAQEGDVVFSDDHHPLSSDTGSLVFRNTDRAANRLSFFTTAEDAAVNDATFEEGYTFEAFVKIDPQWTTDNSWMGAVARGGDRSELGDEVGEVEASPATLAVSSLRELQWNVRPLSGDIGGASAWSHEIPRGEWMHVAIVNDPVARTNTMYVEGAPVLRNQVDMVGIASTGKPWVLGAGLWEGELTDGWLGSIGEVRLVDRPLSDDEWLTARADASQVPGEGSGEPGDGSGEPGEGDIPVTAEIPGMGGPGTGKPGGPGTGEPGGPGTGEPGGPGTGEPGTGGPGTGGPGTGEPGGPGTGEPGGSGTGEPGQGGGETLPGALALSISDGGLSLGEARNRGTHLSLAGTLPTVQVTDSRADSAGWSVTGQSTDLTSGAAGASAGAAMLRAENLGWTPFVVQGPATPGTPVAPRPSGGPGLGTPSVLGSGDGRIGSADLAADVELEAPVDTKSGTYTGAVTLSLFPQD